ncbi:MAG: HlyD family efflux transporter periplasmic adaptor subunit [Ectothiorhodospiraceae bacterium]|nr:HlyD family efflux transporter periplasmic adaptor subunit [Chromatiales bacterium]MCP5154330.1 HlyD family efflux transporter periplasmic adaptor subunit [Ectothiorhodospiraceae bacterium]
MTKRVVAWGLVVGGVAAAVAWSFRPQPVPVELVAASTMPLVVTVDEEGKTELRDVFVVSAPVAGRARRITLEAGDAVEAGNTVVAEIEPTAPAFLDERDRAEARADVAAAEAALVLANAEVEQAKAELDFAEAELRRAQRLAASRTISEQAIDDAERAYRSRRAALVTAQASVRVKEHTLERARSRLTSPATQVASDDVCDCLELHSPVSGQVIEVFHESEAVVAAGDPLLSVGDLSDLEIRAEMLSTDAVKVRPGMRVIVEGWGGDVPLAGEVERIEPRGFTKVSALGIEEQRVNVVVGLRDPHQTWRSLGHGFRVDIRVVLWETDAALTVPVTALFRDGAAWAVFAERDGVAHLTRVDVGRRSGLDVQVTDGLREGDRVILSPSDRVADGVPVVGR